MALDFNSSGRFVNHGSASSLDDLPPSGITVIAWVYRAVNGANQSVASKANSTTVGYEFLISNPGAVEGKLQLKVRFSTTGANYISSVGVVPLNTWTMVAFTFSGTTGKLYAGGLATALAEVAGYSTSTAGVGTYGSDAAASLYFGNTQRDTTLFLKGLGSRLAVYNRALSTAEIETHRLTWAQLSGCVEMSQYEGTGTQDDVSGNGNTGAVTGAGAADDVPLAGLCAASDSALPLTGKVLANAGVATEAESALSLTGKLLATVSPALENSAAFALTGQQQLRAGIAASTNSALALTGKQRADAGLSAENDNALGPAVAQSADAGVALETDTALPATGFQSAAAGRAAELDTAFVLSGAQRRGIGPVNDNEAALPLSGSARSAVGLAFETDLALAPQAAVDVLPARIGRVASENRIARVGAAARVGRVSRRA